MISARGPDLAPDADTPEPGEVATPRRRRPSRFAVALGLLMLVGLGVRFGYVLGAKRHDDRLPGDQSYYSNQADTLAHGHGFRHPAVFAEEHRAVPAADHPPLTAIVAAPATWVTNSEQQRILAQRLIMAIVGSLTVGAVGLAARSAAGRHHPSATGLVAAAIAAVHPTLWINDGLVMSESIGALTIALVILTTYRAYDDPSVARFAQLGAAIGLASLARAEALLLAPLLILPGVSTWVLPIGRPPTRDRVRWLGAAGAALVLVLVPWVGANLVRFHQPTYLSTNDGLTLLGANCDRAWQGDGRGLWMLQCIDAVDTDGDGRNDWQEFEAGTPSIGLHQDYSDQSARYRRAAFRYLRHHLGGLPGVVLTRELRLWGVIEVDQMVGYNTGEGREPWASWAGIIGYWALLSPAVAGLVVLRRRKRRLWPLLAHVVAAAIIAGLFFGLWRFRLGADVAATVAAAIGMAACWEALFRRGSRGAAPNPEGLTP